MALALAVPDVQTAVCKSVQSIGISPRKEHQIENAMVRQLESSGAEFVLSRLGSLRDWRKMHMKGDTSYHPEWFRFSNHKGVCTPADALGSQLWTLSDKAFFAVTGAMQKAIELSIPSEKQLNKWVDGVRCENTSAEQRCTRQYNEATLDWLEGRVAQEWTNREWFNVSDITGTNIPGSGKYMSVAYSKKDSVKDPYSLLAAYGFSCNTAPLFVWQFLKDIDAPSLMAKGLDDPDELIGSLQNLIDSKLSDFSLEDEAISGSSFYEDTRCKSGRSMIDRTLGFAHSVGNIGFLEQSGGKLRSVANPNRLVQYVNVPLGKAFSALQDRITGVYVRNQEAGMDWASDKLRQGVSLSSFDMSSATDRLDFSKWLHEKFKPVYTSPNKWPLLARSLELFEDTSKAPWTIPGHVADLLGMQGNEVSWSVGQPLGLRPSFPTLTLMNADFARIAIRKVDKEYSPGHFACVGDDLIIETKYAEAYMGVVKAFNGKINNDKTMESDRYAEFCSHMITKSSRYPLKPRFILEADGSFGNIEKFSTSGIRPAVPAWARDLHGFIAAYHIDGMRKIPYSVTSNPKSLNERIGVNALIEAMHPGPRDDSYVTLQTLYTRAMEIESRKGVLKAKELSSSYANDAYPSFGGSSSQPEVKDSYDEVNVKDYHVLGQVSTDGTTSVVLPVKTDWDYRENAYVSKPTSEASVLRGLRKKIERVSVQADDTGLITATSVDKQFETTIVVDTVPEVPQAIIATNPRKRSGKHSLEKPNEAVQDLPVPQPIQDAIRSKLLSERCSSQANDALAQLYANMQRIEEEAERERSEDDSLDYR